MDDILRSKPTPSHKIQPDIIEEEEEDKVILGSTEKLPSVNFNSIRSPLKATQPVYISPKSSALPPLNLETMNNVGGRSNSAPDSVDKISEPASTISKLVFIYKLDIIIFIYQSTGRYKSKHSEIMKIMEEWKVSDYSTAEAIYKRQKKMRNLENADELNKKYNDPKYRYNKLIGEVKKADVHDTRTSKMYIYFLLYYIGEVIK